MGATKLLWFCYHNNHKEKGIAEMGEMRILLQIRVQEINTLLESYAWAGV